MGQDAADVAALKPVVRHLQAAFASAGPPPGLQLHLAGPVASNAASNASGNKATGRIGLFSIVFIVVLLLIVLRSPVAAMVTFVPSVVALLVSEQFVAGLGAHGLQISSVTETLLVVLLLGAGTDYGLFLVYRFREELAGRDRAQGGASSARSPGSGRRSPRRPGTVILALLTLLLAGFGLYHDLGVPLALGIAVMLLAGLTLLPALLALTAGVDVPRRWAAGPPVRSRAVGAAGGARGAPPGRWSSGIGVLLFAGAGPGRARLPDSQPEPVRDRPGRVGRGAGNALVTTYFPQSSASPSDLVLRYATPVWQHPGPLRIGGGQPVVVRPVRRAGGAAGPERQVS